MKLQHTPGPWMAVGRQVEAESLRTSPNIMPPLICEVEREPNGEANARLIAAAPDLLEQLDQRAGNLETLANYIELWLKHGAVKPERADTPRGQTMVDAARICAAEARTIIAGVTGETP